jgi:hypothetical protein
MQQVNMIFRNICRTTRRHTPETAIYSNISTVLIVLHLYMGRDSSFGIATRYVLVRVSNPGGVQEFSHLPKRKCGPFTILENECQGFFLRTKYRGMALTTRNL